MNHPIFYRPEMNVADLSCGSPSAGKPAAFMEMLRRNRLASRTKTFEPVTKEDLYLVHDKEFVDGVFDGTILNGFENNDPRVAQACLYTVGSMVAAAQYAHTSWTAVCSPTSGFHHAGYARAGGYCTFNGLMVAAAKLLEGDSRRRVGILDCDMHRGDGTEDILAHKPELSRRICHLTSGRYFYEGERASDFFAWLRSSITLLNAFGCDVVLYQAGADQHIKDPLGGLLTSEEISRRDRMVFNGIRAGVAWNLAGGYQTVTGKTEVQRLAPVLDIHVQTRVQAGLVSLQPAAR
jgi:acetoin utilization deacetylase AcuC-like enzyme